MKRTQKIFLKRKLEGSPIPSVKRTKRKHSPVKTVNMKLKIKNVLKCIKKIHAKKKLD